MSPIFFCHIRNRTIWICTIQDYCLLVTDPIIFLHKIALFNIHSIWLDIFGAKYNRPIVKSHYLNPPYLKTHCIHLGKIFFSVFSLEHSVQLLWTGSSPNFGTQYFKYSCQYRPLANFVLVMGPQSETLWWWKIVFSSKYFALENNEVTCVFNVPPLQCIVGV